MYTLEIILSLLFLSFSVYFLIKEIEEILFLKQVLKKIIGKSQITEKKDLIKIKNYLNQISYNMDLKSKRRPILRNTASQILKSHYGFCGENSRVAIKLLLLGGLRARRIYLFRKEWQHVLIEHEFNNSWYMFDGHFDEYTVLKDEDVASILTENLSNYPDNYPNNPYLEYCRVKMFYMVKPLRYLAKIKLPSFVIYLSESPYLIKVLMTLILAGFSFLIFY